VTTSSSRTARMFLSIHKKHFCSLTDTSTLTATIRSHKARAMHIHYTLTNHSTMKARRALVWESMSIFVYPNTQQAFVHLSTPTYNLSHPTQTCPTTRLWLWSSFSSSSFPPVVCSRGVWFVDRDQMLWRRHCGGVLEGGGVAVLTGTMWHK
jgi:hypothetical protein